MSLGTHDGGQYYIRDRGHVQGPFDMAELRRRVVARRVTRQHQVSSDGFAWHKINDLLPELFPAASAPQLGRPAPTLLEPTPLVAEVPQQLPQESTTVTGEWPGQSKPVNTGRYLAMAVTMLAVVAPLAVVGWLAMLILIPASGDRAVAIAMRPSLVTIQGIHPGEGKKRCLGVVVSRTLCIAPLMAATLDGVKIEARHKDGHSEWHTSRLQTADPVTGLCVLRADFGGDVTAVDLPDSKQLPSRRATLRLLTPDDESSCDVQDGVLDKVLNEDEPDEMLQIDVDDEAECLLGRIAVDKDGRLAGLAVGRLPSGEILCASAFELRGKKKEAAKLPADHSIDTLDLPFTAFLPGGAVGKRPDSLPPAGEQVADKVPTTQQRTGTNAQPDPGKGATTPASAEAASDDGADTRDTKETPKPTSEQSSSGKRKSDPKVSSKKTPSSGAGLPLVVRSATELVTDVTDSVVPLPELPPDTARKLGERQLADVCKSHRRTRDQPLQNRMRQLADKVFLAADRRPADFTVTVVEDPDIQAFAFVGGNIVINTGFIDFAAGDTEMIRFVMAHEIGHLILGHVEMPYRREMMTGAMVGEQLNTVIKNSPFNQAEEEEADCFAVDIHRKQRWPIRGGVRFFEKIRDREEESDGAADLEKVVETMFSSHPDHERRIELLTNGCDQ